MRLSRFAFLAGIGAAAVAPVLPSPKPNPFAIGVVDFTALEGPFIVRPVPYFIIDQFWVTEASPTRTDSHLKLVCVRDPGERPVLGTVALYPPPDATIDDTIMVGAYHNHVSLVEQRA